jgi:hypothetical protein
MGIDAPWNHQLPAEIDHPVCQQAVRRTGKADDFLVIDEDMGLYLSVDLGNPGVFRINCILASPF